MEILKKLFASRKFVTSLGGILAVLLMHLGQSLGFPLSEEQAASVSQYVAVMVGTYVVSQGIADHGSSAEAIRTNGNGGSLPPVKPEG